jgi:hypothetical protein
MSTIIELAGELLSMIKSDSEWVIGFCYDHWAAVIVWRAAVRDYKQVVICW